MPKHIRRKKTTSPARAKPRAAAGAVAAAAVTPAPEAKATPAKKRGRRRGLLSGLGTHEHERDILDQYLHEVSKTPLLTQKEEIALARKVRAGDQEAMQELVKRNLRFVISVAKKYQNRGLALTDLIGEGNVGLLTAARKFDPDHGVKFISYAVWWIRQAILAALARHGRTVRVPLNRTAANGPGSTAVLAPRATLACDPAPGPGGPRGAGGPLERRGSARPGRRAHLASSGAGADASPWRRFGAHRDLHRDLHRHRPLTP